MKKQHHREVLVVAALLASTLGAATPGNAQLQWKSADEKLTFKVGLLGQMQAESADVAGSDDVAKNLFFRRARILMSFTLGEKLSVFLDTDSPNLGKAANATGVKDSGDIYIQDFVVTWKSSDKFLVDAGMILPVTSYNHNQSAASLMPVDYGPYTFVESAPLGARVGRDYGLQGRGYLAADRLEYRFGVFQGARGINADNSVRTTARLMYQFFTPQKGLFYRGTSLGKTKTVAIGTSWDQQEEYDSLAFDLFADLPFNEGNGLTFQADYVQADGDVFLTTLAEQANLLAELGFYFAGAKIMPFVQYADQDFDDATKVDQEKWSLGIGYFPAGHNNNLKLSYSQIEPSVGKSLTQINIQWQIFQF